jgi:hypothetical protein
VILEIAEKREITRAHGGMEEKHRDIGVSRIPLNYKKPKQIQDGYNDEGREGKENEPRPVGHKIIGHSIKCEIPEDSPEPDLTCSEYKISHGMDQFMQGDYNGHGYDQSIEKLFQQGYIIHVHDRDAVDIGGPLEDEKEDNQSEVDDNAAGTFPEVFRGKFHNAVVMKLIQQFEAGIRLYIFDRLPHAAK